VGCWGLILVVFVGCVREHPVWHAPVWSGDGSRLYYGCVRPDGSLGIREVEVASGVARDLAISPLRHRPVAFEVAPGGDRGAYVVREPDGAVVLYLVGRGCDASEPLWRGRSAAGEVDLAWMPDGGSLVLAVDEPDGGRVLRVRVGGGVRVLADGFAGVRGPAVSPDGRLVAFVGREERGVAWGLFVASCGDGARRGVAPALFEDYRLGYWPAWSPDGRLLAYVAERYLRRGYAEIWLWEKASGLRRVVARCLAGSCFAPTWSPKGDRLAFVRCSFGGDVMAGWPSDIVVVGPDGEGERTIVGDGLGNLMPAWSPDGSRVAWNVVPAGGKGPHVVELAEVASCVTRLAARDAAAGLVLALARLERGKPGAATRAAALAAQLAGHPVAGVADAMLAAHYRGLGEWSRVAAHAARAARVLGGEERVGVLRLLAEARARLGDAQGAVRACERILASGDDPAASAMRRRLQEGLAAQARLEKAIGERPSPSLLLRLAAVRVRQLGNPAASLATLLRLIRIFPEGGHREEAARLVLEVCGRMGPGNLNGRLLEWAAGVLGLEGLRPPEAVLVARGVAAIGRTGRALGILEGLVARGALGPAEKAEAFLAVGEHLAARGERAEALAALERAATGSARAAGRAALGAARLAARAGRHWQAARLLLRALDRRGGAETMRAALGELTALRLRRAAPMAYEAAYAAALVDFAYFEAGVEQAERLLPLVPEGEPLGEELAARVDRGWGALVGYLRRTGQVGRAIGVSRQWLARGRGKRSRARALAALAECHGLAGDRRAEAAVLTRLAVEFPGTPEGAWARRELLRLQSGGSR